MTDDPWAPFDAALDRAHADGIVVDFWLRDDDAVAPTPALGRLADLAGRFAVPVLLAVIPELTDPSLAAFLKGEPLLTPTQHGFAHVNHAGEGQRACELGGARPLKAVIDDLERGRARMTALFGLRHAAVLVPPWNRIAPALLPELPRLGFTALSTFADQHLDTATIAVRNCDLDIIDWRGGRRGHPVGKLAGRLATLVDRGGPVGLLTHHLAHDETAWVFLGGVLDRLHRHPAARFLDISAMLARQDGGHARR